MKKIILLSAVFFCCLQLSRLSLQAQTLYCTTPGVGNHGVGTINKFVPATNNLIVTKHFNDDFNPPVASLIQASDGKLYGMTYYGDNGTIFSFDPSSSAYTKLSPFLDVKNGGGPFGSLMQASDGKLYGMTSYGGSRLYNGYGVIFSFDPSSSTYVKLIDFDYTNGSKPYGNLIQASDGKLYGMTTQGGSAGVGVIFSFDPSSSTYTKLKDFGGFDGAYPFGNLMQASDGNLYGMVGSNIFSFDISSSAFTKWKVFGQGYGDFPQGKLPRGSLIQASDGKLYGMTTQGGSSGVGVIFSFDPSSSAYIKLKDFDGTNGGSPYGNLMQASDGKFYGMTWAGGSKGLGVIFSFDPLTSIYTKLQDYDGINGANPGIGSAFIEIRETNKPPKVNLKTLNNNSTYIAAAFIKLHADASDTDGTITKVEFFNGTTLLHTEYATPYGYYWPNIPAGDYTLTAKATDNDGNVTTSNVVNISVIPNKPPTVNIISPVNGATYTSPKVIIPLSADAHDPDGYIKKVDFYNGNTLIFTEDAPPFSRNWLHVPVGNYSITARATDNKGAVSTSAAINISVVPDIAPLVLITSPFNGATYTSPATIQLTADAIDIDGTIKTVDFYNGSTLLFTEKFLPYSRTWLDVPEGNYSITAIATDNNGKSTTSPPVAISVGAAAKSMVSGSKLNSLNRPISLNINPNPVAKTLNVSIEGLQTNSKSGISILSVSGAVIKTLQANTLNKNVKLDVSSLSAGVYIIKVVSGDKVLYKQFVKL